MDSTLESILSCNIKDLVAVCVVLCEPFLPSFPYEQGNNREFWAELVC